MTLTAKALEKQAAQALHGAMTREGFERGRKASVFSRPWTLGADLLWVHAAKRGSERRIWALWVDVGLRVEPLQRVVERYLPLPAGTAAALSPTVATTVHQLAPLVVPKVWLVDGMNPEDVEHEINALIGGVLEFGLPFLEKLHELEILLAVLRKDHGAGAAISLDPTHRCFLIVTLWMLLGRGLQSQETRDLILGCREELRLANGNLPLFDEFAVNIHLIDTLSI